MQSVQVGQVLEFHYPRHNYHQVHSKLERRRLLVQRIRDLAAEPLEPLTTQLDPLKRRGRLLVTGQDLDRRAERSFYLDSMQPAAPDAKPFAVVAHGPQPSIVFESTTDHEANAFADEWNRLNESGAAFVATRPE